MIPGMSRMHVVAVVIVAVAAALTINTPALAQSGIRTVASQRLQLVRGKSVVIESPVSVTRASIADPEVADALVLSPRQIYVTGAKIGATNLTLWQGEEQIYSVFDVTVTPDIVGLKSQLHDLFPEETNLQVNAAQDHITLAGAVSSPVKMQRALAIAEAYAPEKVVNLMQVGGLQQVMLDVRVAEMNRNLTRRLGINLAYSGNNGTDFGVTTLNDHAAMVSPSDAVLLPNYETPVDPVSPAITPFGLIPVATTAVLRWQAGGTDWTAFVDALKENGLVKILAEPNLVALSGQEASFLAGGEFPFPVPGALGTISIQFKKFGVGLQFTPTVLSDNLISIEVAPEVSELDFSNAVTISGFLIPAITTRRAATVVELRDGQSFAIAGLIREALREQVSKFPLLGDVPVLGTLFRSSDYQKNESELVIIVTPRLVKPVDGRELTVPTEFTAEPNDFDFYLMGKVEVVDPNRRAEVPGEGGAPTTVSADLEGDFGHSAP